MQSLTLLQSKKQNNMFIYFKVCWGCGLAVVSGPAFKLKTLKKKCMTLNVFPMYMQLAILACTAIQIYAFEKYTQTVEKGQICTPWCTPVLSTKWYLSPELKLEKIVTRSRPLPYEWRELWKYRHVDIFKTYAPKLMYKFWSEDFVYLFPIPLNHKTTKYHAIKN